ncbi:hypothetical protein O9K51_02715 [Purpureocillium lavendulum]|uniref:Uncharacterized protein n=1 Tax=Purpureocillium lavendulum TaxID=1247861 RepID=A0AB34G0C3_9HYPO|nr:hypothetical protein O9K51_02715 [Purpureocillium lavendulum]
MAIAGVYNIKLLLLPPEDQHTRGLRYMFPGESEAIGFIERENANRRARASCDAGTQKCHHKILSKFTALYGGVVTYREDWVCLDCKTPRHIADVDWNGGTHETEEDPAFTYSKLVMGWRLLYIAIE